MKKALSSKGIVGLGIVLAVIVLLAILPKIIMCFQPGAPFGEQILKFVIYIGGLILVWIVLLILILLLNMLGLLFLNLFGGNAEDFDKGVGNRAVIISAIVVVTMQFIDAWGIKLGFIDWFLSQLFPFMK